MKSHDIKHFAIGAAILGKRKVVNALQEGRTKVRETKEYADATVQVAKDNGSKVGAAFVAVESTLDGVGGLVGGVIVIAHHHPMVGGLMIGWSFIKTGVPLIMSKTVWKENVVQIA